MKGNHLQLLFFILFCKSNEIIKILNYIFDNILIVFNFLE